MATSYNHYSANDGNNDYNTTYAYDETDRTHPQHVATPHGAMTEILAATGSTSPPSPRHNKLRRPSTTSNRPSANNKESVAKRALRRKAAKHFHRGNSNSSAGNSSTGSSGNSNKDLIDNKNVSSSAANVKETISSGAAAIRSSDKYYYPAEFASSVPVKQEAKSDNGSDGSPSLNVISPSSENSNGANINGPLDKIIEDDDPEIEIYEEESASEIGSGYNSGSDLENAARKILQRRNQSLQKSSSKPNYDSDDNASDTGSAVSSSASSSFRKLPDGWKERIKRKAGMPKLPPTMEKSVGKKEKIPPSSSVAQKPPKEQTQLQLQQEKDQLQSQLQQQQQEQLSREATNEELSQSNSSEVNDHHDHFNAIASVCEDSDDDEYYQDHFNGEVNGAFPSFTNGYNHEMDSRGMDLLNNPPIYEEHVFGPVKPSTIYESNDEYDHDENDDSLFDEEWNPDNLISKGDDDVVGNKSSIPPIQEVDEAGFPSPSRKIRADERVKDTGMNSSSSANNDQSVRTSKGIEHTQNDFNKDDYFHDFSQGWEQNFLPPPGVHWKSSTTQENTSPSPDTAGDGIPTTSVTDEDATIPSFAWSDSSFRDNTAASASIEGSTLTVKVKKEKSKAKEQPVITSLPVRQKKKKKGKALPTMQPFSDGDLSDPGNDVSSNGEGAVVGTTQVKAKRGLKFFKRRGQSSHQSDSERSDSEWDTDASRNSQRLKGLSPLSRKGKSKKQAPKSNDLRRKLFGSSPKKQEMNYPRTPTETQAEKAQDTTPIAETPAVKVKQETTPISSPETNLKPDHPFRSTTPIASNLMKADDDKPCASVDVDEKDATDDKSMSTLGSIITKETSSKAVRVPSSSASANTAMSEIERLRKENDKLRQELERQAVRRENERLRQELEKRNADGAIGGNDRGKQNSPRNGKHKMSLSSLLENNGILESNTKHDKRRDRRHHVTKNHLMNQADFDDETTITQSPTRRGRRLEYASESVGWVVSQVRNAAQDHGHRPLDCFTACTRSDRGRRRRRRHHSKGRYDDNDSDTDSLDEDTSFLRNGDRPRPPIARRSR